MEFLKRIYNENNLLIVCNNINKKQILKELNKSKKIINISFLTLDSFLSKVTFFYDYQAIYELMKNKNMNYDTAKMYLSNLYLLSLIKDYGNQENKYNKLKEIYDYLLSKNLITFDNLFINDLKNKKIIIDSSYLTNNNLLIIKDKLNGLNYELIDFSNNEYEDKLFDCLCFENINNEINNQVEGIANAVKTGININSINIVLGDNSYLETLKRTLNDYGFKYNIKNVNSIYNTNTCKKVLDYYFNNEIESIEQLRNAGNEEIINKTIDCINKYAILPNDDIKRIIINKDLKNIYKNEVIYDNAIQIVDVKSMEKLINQDDLYVFVLGFCEGSFPVINKDEGYFTAKTLLNNGLDTAINLNQISKKKTIYTLSNIKNLFLSVSERNNFEPINKSSLIKLDENNKVVLNNDLNYSCYSDKLNKALYSSRWYKFDKYHEQGLSLPELAKEYSDKIEEYDNSFTGIDNDKFLNDFLKKPSISYSSLDNYHHCPFKYYVNNVLKFSQFSNNFSTVVGGAYHEAIEKSFDNDLHRLNVDAKEIYDEAIIAREDDYKFSISEEYFSSKIREELPKVIDCIEKQYEEINYKSALYEQNVTKEFTRTIDGEDVKITFTGFIDKILYNDKVVNGKKVRDYVVIDYKTGKSTAFERKYIKYGLSLQLITYIYLENYNLSLDNTEGRVGGFFLQHILTSFPKDDEERNKSLAFDGGINLDSEIEPFVKDATNGIIQKMGARVSEDNKASVTKEDINEYLKCMDDKTNEAIDGIISARFDISPIRIEGDSIKDGCVYCEFKDICFKKFTDYKRYKLGETKPINDKNGEETK